MRVSFPRKKSSFEGTCPCWQWKRAITSTYGPEQKQSLCCENNERFSSNRRPMFCAQDSGIARGQTLRIATKNVWRGVVSSLKAVSLDRECRILLWFYEKRWWLMLGVEISRFCVINAINSTDKHSLREVEGEIYVYWIYTVSTWRKGLEIYSANLGIHVGGLAHLSV